MVDVSDTEKNYALYLIKFYKTRVVFPGQKFSLWKIFSILMLKVSFFLLFSLFQCLFC